jgi:hypothetical protein
MASGHDWLPDKEQDLLELLKHWNAWLGDTAKQTAFEWGAAECGEVLAKIGDFENARTEHQDTRTHGKWLTKIEKKKALFAAMRAFANSSVRFNGKMTAEDKLYLGIRPHDKVPTQHPKPNIQPETDAAPVGSRKHGVTAINPETKSKKKPPLVKGVAFASRLRLPDEPRAEAENMPSIFQAETTRNFFWKEADIGKVADYATAYENEGYVRGPWSNVVSVIVA